MSQLGNRVQHTLRAYTPAEQKIVRASADSFRTNPKFDTAQAILELGTGEALVSFQDAKGAPTVVERITILPPQSQMGVIDDMARQKIINNSPFAGKYDEEIDPESAYEIITKMKVDAGVITQEVATQSQVTQAQVEQAVAQAPAASTFGFDVSKYPQYQTKAAPVADPVAEKLQAIDNKAAAKTTTRKSTRMTTQERAINNFVGSASSAAGRSIMNKIMKGLFK